MSSLTTIAYMVPAFVILLTIVVFVHEFGHFIVGRWCGVQVDAFSMGFGPELWSRVDRYGTRWRIAAIPLGGYVKFHGDANGASAPDLDALENMPETERAVTFAAQPLWARAAIVFAGPFANFILAIALLTSILYVNGRIVLEPRIGVVLPDGAGAAAGFKPGDVVVSIDGTPVAAFSKMQEIVSGSAEKKLDFVIRRDGQDMHLDAVPAWREIENPAGKIRIGMLGLQASTAPGDSRAEKYGLVQSFGLAVEEVWMISSRSLGYMGGLITGRESAEQLSGPIGIAQMSGQVAQAAAKVGITPFLNWIALLSVSIGLLNLMPVPLLDGGHLLFYGIEAIRGQALNERTQEFAFRIGLAMVGALMIFSTYNDLARLFQRLTGGAS
jgi:regulator of sigma E protease